MQANFTESQTRINLMRAFAGECQSRQRYYQAALTAQQQKLVGLERMFRFTAEQEERHAMVFWKLLKEGTGQDIDISAGFHAEVTEEIQKLLDASEREEKKEF
jgi:rubrerythrin